MHTLTQLNWNCHVLIAHLGPRLHFYFLPFLQWFPLLFGHQKCKHHPQKVNHTKNYEWVPYSNTSRRPFIRFSTVCTLSCIQKPECPNHWQEQQMWLHLDQNSRRKMSKSIWSQIRLYICVKNVTCAYIWLYIYVTVFAINNGMLAMVMTKRQSWLCNWFSHQGVLLFLCDQINNYRKL